MKNLTTLMDRALVVDDEAALRHLICRSLQEEGFSCDQACDGLDAMDKLQHGEHDITDRAGI